MAPKKVRERKLQSKLNLSPAPKAPPTATTMPTRAVRKTAKRAPSCSSSEDELQDATERNMRLGLPVESTPFGMFDNSDPDPSSSESEEDQVTKLSASRKHRRRVDESDDSNGDEATVKVIPRTRQRGIQVTVESSNEDENLRLPNKRRKTRHQGTLQHSSSLSSSDRPTRQRSTEDDEASEKANDNESDEIEVGEEEELKEELDFLTSSPPPDRGKLRSMQRKPMNARQKALEALKKRRASANTISSATPVRRKTVIVESESDSELDIIVEESHIESNNTGADDDETEDSGDEFEESRSRVADARTMFQEEQEDVDFIDDENTLIGEPAANADLDEIRLMNHLSRAKPSELFKHAIEWMVMKKIHPAFDSKADIYEVTFRKLDDEVKGLARSKYTSAAWTSDFRRSVQARPILEMNEISSAVQDVLAPHCEACNRTNHVASFEVMLTGPPYDAETLEPLETGDSDSDSALSEDPETHSNGEKIDYDAQGEPLPPESRRFTLGSTCKANAQVAHTLNHWRYHLYQWVKDYLARKGHLSPEELVKRDKWNDKKREKAAQKIADAMEKDGEVRKLYHLYKDQVEFALQTKNDFQAGWGRRW